MPVADLRFHTLNAFAWVAFACLGWVPECPAQSESSHDSRSAPTPWDYSLGGTFKSSDLAKLPSSAGLEPIAGLQYGRWKLGIGDGSEWLRFNSFRKDSSLDYKWLDTRRYSLSLSMQFHTLTAGEGSDAPESGQRTVRGRAIGSMAITRRCLEVCAEFANPVGVITKSDLVEQLSAALDMPRGEAPPSLRTRTDDREVDGNHRQHAGRERERDPGNKEKRKRRPDPPGFEHLNKTRCQQSCNPIRRMLCRL